MSVNHHKSQLPCGLPELVNQLTQVLEGSGTHNHHVARYLSAQKLEAKLDLDIGDEACKPQQMVSFLKQYMHYTPKIWHPDFNKLLFSGIDSPGVLADWVTSITNTTMHTYQVAPVATLMERELIKKLNHLIGFNDGDGIMVSGGSMANMVAMMLARHQKCPKIKEQGYGGKTLVAYVSELSHYSFQKAANVLGIGSENLIAVASDNQGRLCHEALEGEIKHSIKQGKQPFFIGLTAGTTVIGSFDIVDQAAKIAQIYDLWLHIDGAWGGPMLFSEKASEVLPDTQLADSFTWDAHKLMNVPQTASAIMVKNKTILDECCSGGGGAYLFHEDENQSYNLGSKSLQCGRRVDSLKFWLSWKAMGSKGYTKKVDDLLALKDYMVKQVSSASNFKLLAPANYLNVLFRYQPEFELSEEKLAQLNVNICKTMLKKDLGYVDYAQYKGQLGIRFILANIELSEAHIDRFLTNCQQLGHKLSDKYID